MTTGVGGCGGGCSEGCGGIALVLKREVLEPGSLSPAQAAARAQARGTYGDWVRDVPVQGPTDEGIRRAGCWWKNNALDTTVDWQGRMVPRSAQSSALCVGGRSLSGVGETLRRGGRVVGALGQTPAPAGGVPAATTAPTAPPAGTAPAGAPPQAAAPPAPPGLWATLSSDEAHWVAATLVQLNALIVKAGNKPCPTWPADLLATDQAAVAKMPAAVACFQGWANTNLKPSRLLRLDGELDKPTLCALLEVTRRHAPDFPTPYPGNTLMLCGWAGLPTAAKVGVGVAAAAAVGGTVWAIAAAGGKKKPAPAPAGA